MLSWANCGKGPSPGALCLLPAKPFFIENPFY
jgi:hypothetical protein